MEQRKPRKLPQVLTEDERKALLKVPNVKAPTGIRNRCMLGLMVNAGLRVSEVIGKEGANLEDAGGLRLDHIDLDTGELKIINGKGNVDRNLWLDQADVELLKKWLMVRPQTEHDLVFCTLNGEKVQNRYMRAMIERVGKKAGINRRVHPHLLRHTYLTDLYRETKNIRMVQKVAGHADLSTTEIYTHIYDEEIKEAMRKLRSVGTK